MAGTSPGHVWYHVQSLDDETRGAAMTGPEHYRRAGELAAEAHRLPGQGTARPLRSAHPVRITAWADAAGTGSDPAAVIIDA